MIRVIRQKSLLQRMLGNFQNFKFFSFLGVMTLIAGATFYLVTQQQDLRQRASNTTSAEFGFNTHLNAAGIPGYWENLSLEMFKTTVDDISSRGQKWIRLNIAPWESSSAGSPASITWNELNLTKYDEAINYANNKGLKVYLVTSLPDWAKDFSTEDYIKTSELYHTTLANRYKGKITVWQAWNESDSHRFRDYSSIPFGEENNEQYVNEFRNLLIATRNAIKNVDSGILFTSNVGRYPVDSNMFANMNSFISSIESALDIVALDLYTDLNYEDVSSQLNLIKTRFNKPLIVAETGIPTKDGRFTEAQQAEHLAGAINEFKLSDPMAIIVYQYWDTLPDSDKTESSFGIVNLDGTRKSSYPRIMEALVPTIPTPTGLLRVETNPAVGATITVTSLETNQVVLTKEWGVDWEKLPIGNYKVAFSNPNNLKIYEKNVVIPYDRTIAITKNTTTTLVADLTTGNVIITPAQNFLTPTVSLPSPTPTNPPTPTQIPNTPTPTPQTTGLLRVQTIPATAATIKIIKTNGQVVMTSTWGIDWKPLAPGTYYIQFSYPRTAGLKTPKTSLFRHYSDRITEITGNFNTGRTTIVYK